MTRHTLFSLLFLASLVVFEACVEFKDAGLYSVPAPLDTRPSIGGFYALNIFGDFLGDENWHSEYEQCLSVKNSMAFAHEGAGGLHLRWNRQGDGCAWTGMGFGWNGWAPKDMSQIASETAISFYVKSPEGQQKSLPWAVALEDYSGRQAFAGVFPSTIQGGVISDTAWTQVIIPMRNFDYRENDFDLSIVKQFMIQFEASGEIYLDDIRLIPYEAGKAREALAPLQKDANIRIDGLANDEVWILSDSIHIGPHLLRMAADSNFLYLHAHIADQTPLQNIQEGKDIWNGDAIEIALSTNPDADPTRRFLLMSDHHLGIRVSNQPKVWNWQGQRPVEDCKLEIIASENHYMLEAAIPWKSLSTSPLGLGSYSLELAIDLGDESGTRQEQMRWNSSGMEGFHQNPSLWGKLTLEQQP